jgi:hypothetical protein
MSSTVNQRVYGTKRIPFIPGITVLVNAGKKEVWHESERTYHVWHPGQLADRNYFAPHDGSHMSPTALAARQSGRVLPLLENPAVKELRLGRTSRMLDEELLQLAFAGRNFSEWTVSKTRIEMIKLGKMALRKFLPRSVKTYIRSRFRDLHKLRSEQ